MAITREPDGHQWGASMAASGEISMAIDTPMDRPPPALRLGRAAAQGSPAARHADRDPTRPGRGGAGRGGRAATLGTRQLADHPLVRGVRLSPSGVQAPFALGTSTAAITGWIDLCRLDRRGGKWRPTEWLHDREGCAKSDMAFALGLAEPFAWYGDDLLP
jgi:hypothetical protein